MTSTMFAGDRWAQEQSTGGRLTGCKGGTRAGELPVLPWHHSSTTAGQTAVEQRHLLEGKCNAPVIVPVTIFHQTLVFFTYFVFHLNTNAYGA